MHRKIISKGDYALAITETLVCFYSNKSHAYASLLLTVTTVNVITHITGAQKKMHISCGKANICWHCRKSNPTSSAA
jgi:hypothetical protein